MRTFITRLGSYDSQISFYFYGFLFTQSLVRTESGKLNDVVLMVLDPLNICCV